MPTDDIAKLKIDKSRPGPAPVRAKWRAAFILLILLFIVGLLYRTAFSPVIQIETATVSLQYPSSGFTLLNASGYVVAQRKAALAAKATGRLEWLGVEEGSRVRTGEIIARLEGHDAAAARKQAAAAIGAASAQRDQAAAELQDAVRSLQRSRSLLAQGVVSQADFDAAETRESRSKAATAAAAANISVAEAALAVADVTVDYTLIRAPFDGVVLTKNADVGDIVTPLGAAANAKASVVTIADLASLRVEVDVSESSIEMIKVSQPCEILLDALPRKRFPGVVHSIVPTADRSKATVMVKVSFRENDLRILPEMSAKVAFLERQVTVAEEKPKIVVPRSAVVKSAGRSMVYLLQGERVIATDVDAVELPGEMIEIRSGVKSGDKIANNPPEKLKNGSKVKLVQK